MIKYSEENVFLFHLYPLINFEENIKYVCRTTNLARILYNLRFDVGRYFPYFTKSFVKKLNLNISYITSQRSVD